MRTRPTIETYRMDRDGDRDRSLARLKRRIGVAQGQEKGDVSLRGGRVVNVFTRRVEQAEVVIADGVVAAVGSGPWPAERTIDLDGRFMLPGLIDAHMHLESTLLGPAELA